VAAVMVMVIAMIMVMIIMVVVIVIVIMIAMRFRISAVAGEQSCGNRDTGQSCGAGGSDPHKMTTCEVCG
jgi:heme/copper-type cytochrome/quinol oxidase subunit 2